MSARIDKAVGDAAWSLVKSSIASPEGEGRLAKALDGAFGAMLGPVAKDSTFEATHQRGEGGRFIPGTSREAPVHREVRRQQLYQHSNERLLEHLTALRGGRTPPRTNTESRSAKVWYILAQEHRQGLIHGEPTLSARDRRAGAREAAAAARSGAPVAAQVAQAATRAATPPEAQAAQTATAVASPQAGLPGLEREAANETLYERHAREAAENEKLHEGLRHYAVNEGPSDLRSTAPPAPSPEVRARLRDAGLLRQVSGGSGHGLTQDGGAAANGTPATTGAAVRASEATRGVSTAPSTPTQAASQQAEDAALHGALSYFHGIAMGTRSVDTALVSPAMRDRLTAAGVVQPRASGGGHELTPQGRRLGDVLPLPQHVGAAVRNAELAAGAPGAGRGVAGRQGVAREQIGASADVLSPSTRDREGEAARQRRETQEREEAGRQERRARENAEAAARQEREREERAERERIRRELGGDTPENPVKAQSAPFKARIAEAAARVAADKAAGREPNKLDVRTSKESIFRGVEDGKYVERTAEPSHRPQRIEPNPLTLSNQPSLRSVFGDNAPTKESLEKMWGDPDPNGFKIKLDRPESNGSTVTYRGQIVDQSGNSVGSIQRSFRKDYDGLHVGHDVFIIRNADFQGGGGGAKMMGTALQGYKQMGVKDVTVHPAYVGPYAWASFGYNVDSAQMTSIRERLSGFLTGLGIPREKAAEQVANCHTLSHVADLDLTKAGERAGPGNPGLTIHHVSEQTRGDGTHAELDVHLGKRFLLKYAPWTEGKVNVKDAWDPSYQRVKSRLGLVGW